MSSNQITTRDLDAMLGRYQRALDELDMIPDDGIVGLTHGSKLNGIAFRLFTRHDGTGGHQRPPAGADFLGFTKADAYHRLAERCEVLEDVANHQRRNPR